MPLALYELFTVKETIETAIKSVLASETGLSSSVIHLEQSTASKAAPFLEVDFDPGERTGHKYPLGGVNYDDSWQGRLTIRVVTDRSDSGEAATHKTLRAKVIAAMVPGRGLFNDTNLPYHQLIDCRLQSMPFAVRDRDGLDESELVFVTMCQIRSTAFAAVG